MEFSWNEDKRRQTLEDRDLDFRDARLFFDGRSMVGAPSPREGESRWKTTAEIEGRFFTLVWMWRGGKIHVISMRRAHDNEERAHRLVHR